MRELRNLSPKRLVEQDLFVSIRQVILSADDVGDAHLDVIQHHGKVVERMAV